MPSQIRILDWLLTQVPHLYAMSVCRPACLPATASHSVSQSFSQSVSRSVSQSVSLSVCLSGCLSESSCLSVCQSISQSVCLSVSPSICLSVVDACLSVSRQCQCAFIDAGFSTCIDVWRGSVEVYPQDASLSVDRRLLRVHATPPGDGRSLSVQRSLGGGDTVRVIHRCPSDERFDRRLKTYMYTRSLHHNEHEVNLLVLFSFCYCYCSRRI